MNTQRATLAAHIAATSSRRRQAATPLSNDAQSSIWRPVCLRGERTDRSAKLIPGVDHLAVTSPPEGHTARGRGMSYIPKGSRLALTRNFRIPAYLSSTIKYQSDFQMMVAPPSHACCGAHHIIDQTLRTAGDLIVLSKTCFMTGL